MSQDLHMSIGQLLGVVCCTTAQMYGTTGIFLDHTGVYCSIPGWPQLT
jgi:hypothetical protein